MTAWPQLADRIGDRIEITWNPVEHVVAGSGEIAFTFGEYSASFTPPGASEETGEGSEEPAAEAAEEAEKAPGGGELSDEITPPEAAVGEAISGSGHYLAVWQRDAAGHWQLMGEGFTPPNIYGES
jgi:ketosteroid isomerase-like protein